MSGPTTAQRDLIRRLMREAELDTSTVTFQHRSLGVAEHEIGGAVSAWLDNLSISQASQVIRKLQAAVA